MTVLAPPAPETTAPAPKPAPERVRVGGLDPELVAHVLYAGMGSFALTWLVYDRLLPVSGSIGFWLTCYAAFLGLLAAVSATTLDRMAVVDRLVGVLVTSAGLVLVAALAGIVIFTVVRGWAALTHWNFYTQTTAFVGPDAPLDKGGIYAAIVGTIEQVALSVLFSVPLGIATAVYLSEVRGRLARAVRVVTQAMTAVPTIVAGLFIYSMLIITFNKIDRSESTPPWLHSLLDALQSIGIGDRNGLAASLALSVSMIPVVTTTAEVVLRLVPNGLREASLALGTTQWQTVHRVVLPTARAGLVTAILLGVARVIGETSPVLLVAGSTSELNYDPTSGPMLSLPLYVFTGFRQPIDVAIQRAFGAAVVLLLLVVIFFALARIIGGREPGHLSRRQRRRLAAAQGENA